MSEDDVLRQATERVGTTLAGKYHIDSVLGVGGMAVVYAATHRNRKRFAVKVLHPELSARAEIRARFLREGYVANSVNHPGVVAVLDDDVDDDGAAFLVMELLEGDTVDDLRSRLGGRIAVRESLDVAYQLLAILAAAHARAVIHRDIKPANVFVTTEGHVKVLDFGIARLRDVAAGVQATRAGAIVGTPSYMAPEQALAQTDEIDPRSDVWGVGACLFTMLSGQFVHQGDNARQLMIRAATVPARSLADVAPGMPSSVVDIVAKALAFEKSARWGSAAAMREAVARVYQERFGPFSHECLKACLERSHGNRAAAPMLPLRVEAPPTPESYAALSMTSTADEASHATVGRRTTADAPISKPESSRGSSGFGRGRMAVVAVLAAVAGLAVGAFFVRSVSGTPDRPSAAAFESQPPFTRSIPPAPPAEQASAMDVAPRPSLPVIASAASPTAASAVSSARAPTSPIAPAAVARPFASSARAALPDAASAKAEVPAASSANALQRDPLKIQLQ